MPSDGDGEEPDDHDRAEQAADAVRAVALDQRRDPTRMTTVIGTTYALEQRRRDLEPLDRAEDGDRRRDHAVAVEQRGAEDAEQRRAPTSAARRPFAGGREQRGQREDAAFALVVGAHDDGDVLDRDDEQQRVDDQRQHAEDVLVRRRHGVRAEEALAHRVERAGADVAVDDAERRERERKQCAVSTGARAAVRVHPKSRE